MELELKLREVLPLTLMKATSGNTIKGKTKMTKLVFLAEEEFIKSTDYDLDETVTFEFYPYDYGPFSKQLMNDLDRLCNDNVIEISSTRTFKSQRYDYTLTKPGEDGLDDLIRDDDRAATLYRLSKEVIEEYGGLRIRELLDYVYDEYEEYTKNSVYT